MPCGDPGRPARPGISAGSGRVLLCLLAMLAQRPLLNRHPRPTVQARIEQPCISLHIKLSRRGGKNVGR